LWRKKKLPVRRGPSLRSLLSVLRMFLPHRCKVDSTWDGRLFVPFGEKHLAKDLGAQWDVERKVWVVPAAERGRRHLFEAWTSPPQQQPHVCPPASKELQEKRDSITRELALALVFGAAK
jgi:hypothetical protein